MPVKTKTTIKKKTAARPKTKTVRSAAPKNAKKRITKRVARK